MVTGPDLRRAREEQGVGLAKLAAMIGRSKGHLSKVERGVDAREVTEGLVRDYERALNARVSATTTTSPFAPDASHAVSPAPEPAVATVSAPELAAMLLTPPVDGEESEVTSTDVLEHEVFYAWRLRQQANYGALGNMMPGLIRRSEVSAARLEGPDQEQAARLVVHAYNAASSLLRRLGDGPLALLAADRAVRQAEVIGDSLLVAAAMYRLANVLLTARRADETTAVALHAADLIQPGQDAQSLAMWGGLLLTAAVASACGGHEIEAWELIGQAKSASRLLGADRADLFAIFGPTNVAVHGVQVAVELRRGGDAVRRSQAIDPDRLPPDLLERRGQFLIDVAHGHALEGADRDAVMVLQQAARIAPQEVHLNRQVRALTMTMLSRQRAGRTPGLKELAEDLGIAA